MSTNNIFDGLRRDARFAARVLWKSPGFTLIAVFTLALAIAANAVVFGVANGVLLRPLDVPDPETLYGIEHATEHSMYESYPDYRDLRDRNQSFDGLAGFTIEQTGLDTGDSATRTWAAEVTGNYFDVLRIQPRLGQMFHASDERGANSAPFVVLGYDYWHKGFHDDPGVIGRTVRLNTYPFTIIGIAPKGFHGTLAIVNPDLYVPIVQQQQIEGRSRLEIRSTQSVFMTFGHLKPGVTPSQAIADLNAIGAYLDKTYPNERGATTFTLARPGLYGNYLGQPMRAFVAGLMLLSALILLGACANLGSLFAARASDRSREVALRLSLGATRGRVLRQLLTEAVMIGSAGGALGLWASIILLRFLATWQPIPRFPITVPVTPDAKVYVMAILLALVSGILFGLVPARQVWRTDPYQVIKAGTNVFAARRLTVRDVLLFAQVAICGVLITASIVAVRGLGRAMTRHIGFDPMNVLLADTDLSMARYTGDDATAMQKRMADAVAAIPGVASVGVIGHPPLAAGGFLSYLYAVDAVDLRPSNAVAAAERFQISPQYLDAARTTLIAGRGFSEHDDSSSPRVAIMNRELARRLAGGPDKAIGGRFRLRDRTILEIVGVVEDGKYQTLAEEPGLALFVPLKQMPMTQTWLVIRASGDPQALAAQARETLRSVDPGLPVYLQTWSEELTFARFAPRMATLALGIMGAIGALLAITGVFGMAAYAVSKRLKEIGIRIALGATRTDVLRAALGRPLRLLASGAIAGVALGILASRVLASIVYQATPRDPIVLSGVVIVMVVLGLAATWVPARRALSTDPLPLLRQE